MLGYYITFIWHAFEGARFFEDYKDDEDDVNDAKKKINFPSSRSRHPL